MPFITFAPVAYLQLLRRLVRAAVLATLISDLTGLYLQPILQHLTKLESCGGCSLANLEQIYKDIVHSVKQASDETIPTCKKDFLI